MSVPRTEPDEFKRTVDQVVDDVTDATRLIGRAWAKCFEPHLRERVREIIEQGVRMVESREADMWGTGGIEIRRDDPEQGFITVSVVVGTKWESDADGPEWT